jgi:putative transposase
MQIINQIVSVLESQFSRTNLQHFALIIESILGISHSVTTLSVARYSSLSYRTVQRFYALKDVNWLLVNLLLFKHFVYQKGKTYLLAADETVVSKAGKQTYGLGLFYASTRQQVIRSVSFLAVCIIDIAQETSYILGVKQLIAHHLTKKNEPSGKLAPAKEKPKTKPKGRPKGSKNKPKTEPQSASYQLLKSLLALIDSQFKSYLPTLHCFHLALDGFYGHENYVQLACTYGLKIVSKFKTNAHLILPYQGTLVGQRQTQNPGREGQFGHT